MDIKLSGMSKALIKPLSNKARILLFVAAIVLIPTFFYPLWYMQFWSYQYPDSLTLYIYSHQLDGGDDGNDITEINILNHYIGMAELEEENFTELKWIPLAIGIFIVLTMRAAVFARIGKVVDVLMLFTYFGCFSLWSFWYNLSSYGQNLDPKASVNIEPFTPPLFGFEQVGQFKVWSYPHVSSYLMGLFALLLVLSIVLSLKTRNESGMK
ncbi:MAG: hypothetical protein GY865_07575 [candidate division Zixibacteria bacterium]|nr:hypothetical protein [candidate division Zixibacteria bacterium]